MVLSIILFFIGFYILIKGANFLVLGASSFARRFHISNIITGLVIAGIGTSIPEFAIFFLSNLYGEGDIGLGTIIGSNTFNILFILGVTAIAFPLVFKSEWVRRDLLWNIFAVFIVAAFTFFVGFYTISRLEGLILLILFFIWLYIIVKKANSMETEGEPFRIVAFPLAAVLILAGLVGVILGGKWVVDGAIVIAREIGLNEKLIALTLVSIGTSLPEFAVTFVAALKKQTGIAIGNIIGSNIFDFLMIIGFSALIKPAVFPSVLFFDVLITMVAALLLYGAMFVGARNTLGRSQGLLFVVIYVFYIVFIGMRG